MKYGENNGRRRDFQVLFTERQLNRLNTFSKLMLVMICPGCDGLHKLHFTKYDEGKIMYRCHVCHIRGVVNNEN